MNYFLFLQTMGLTVAQRQARFRRKREEADHDKYETFLKVDCERKRRARVTARGKRTDTEQKDHLASERARIRQIRERQRKRIVRIAQDFPERTSPFRTRQSAGKALKRARASLPKSPRKKKAIAAEIAKDAGLEVIYPKRNLDQGIGQELAKKIVDFYCLDEISWQAPGRKDHVIIRTKDDAGVKQKVSVQSRYMLMSLSEAYQSFKKDNAEKIGLSKFCELRPKHIKLFDQIPHNVCVCVYHENVRLLLWALKGETGLPDNISKFTNELVCDPESEQCMSLECNACRGKIKDYMPQDTNDDVVTYYQWQKAEKLQLAGTISEIFHTLEEKIPKFLDHVYTKRKQAAFMEHVKSKVDGEEILVQVDFSENASLGYQNEIQSVHWTYKQATLFTCHAWIKPDETENIVLVSDDLNHTKVSVHAFMTKLLSTLKQKYPSIKRVHVFSDGASSQFKQRFLFSNIHHWENDLKVALEWHFFATSHGKGVVDGLGGTVKRSVWRYVKSGMGEAANPVDFSRIAAERNPGIQIMFVSQESIQAESARLNAFWDDVTPVTNTHKLHSIKSDGPYHVLVGVTSDAVKIRSRIRSVTSEDSCSDDGSTESSSDVIQTDTPTEVIPQQAPVESSHSDVQADAIIASIESQKEHAQKMEESLAKFEKYVCPWYSLLPTPSDGNCLFWALSQQLDIVGKQHTHYDLRKLLVDYMESLPESQKEELQESMTSTYDEYLSEMKTDGSYADHVAVSALGKILGVKIVVHQESGDTTIGTSGQQIHIGFIPEVSHFVALKSEFHPHLLDECCYAVYYTDPIVEFHIGRAIRTECTCDSFPEPHLQMKFLQKDILSKMFHWVTGKHQYECVPKQCVFYGPIGLIGAGPFNVANMEDLEQQFEKLKLHL